jgi:hypothetical protein
MTRKEQISTIHQAYDELDRIGLQDGFSEVASKLRDMNTDAERRHRRFAPNGIRHGLTVADAAKLFTCSHLLDGWNNQKWTVDDILHIRTECLYAQAYATKHYKELMPWATKWTAAFEQVDYAELQKVAA